MSADGHGCGVTIPFARALADAVPPAATRLRRDFGAILALIRTHALLHRATREHDKNGRTIATVEDYAVVRELVADLISEGVGRTVSPETRETVQAVERLEADHDDGVRQTALAAELELDRGTVSRRVRKALDGGYLRNLEEKRGKPHRLLRGSAPRRAGDPPRIRGVARLHGCADPTPSEQRRLDRGRDAGDRPRPDPGAGGVMRYPATPGEFDSILDFLEPVDRERHPGIARMLFEQVSTCPRCGEPVRRCDPRRPSKTGSSPDLCRRCGSEAAGGTVGKGVPGDGPAAHRP